MGSFAGLRIGSSYNNGRNPVGSSTATGGGAVGGTTGTTVPPVNAPTMPSTLANAIGANASQGRLTVQAPKVNVSAAPDPRMLAVYNETARTRDQLASNTDADARLAMAREQQAGEREAKLARAAAAARGATPESGVSQVLQQRARMAGEQSASRLGSELASSGRDKSIGMLSEQGGMAASIAGQELNTAVQSYNQALASQQLALQVASENRQAAEADANRQLQLAALMANFYS